MHVAQSAIMQFSAVVIALASTAHSATAFSSFAPFNAVNNAVKSALSPKVCVRGTPEINLLSRTVS